MAVNIFGSRLTHAQTALLTSARAHAYLRKRGIPLDVARATGLGFAPRSTWPHRRGKSQPRIVAPLTAPDGTLLSLHGRATVLCDKRLRHDILPGAGGLFHVRSLSEDSVILCEGIFDTLACLAAGRPAIGMCGLSLREAWWAQIPAPRIILALDSDRAGQHRRRALEISATKAGKQVSILEPDHLEGYKDLNQYWVARQSLPIPLRAPLPQSPSRSTMA